MDNLTETMTSLVCEFEQSGMTQKAFSASKGMGFHKFNYWYRKLKKEAVSKESAARFIEVDTSGAHRGVSALEVSYPNGVRVSVPSGDLSVVSSLIKLY
ncbi:hypothetical protein GCM10028791_26380 [Echinicola sediminis]